jgi:hypothetical protein
MHVRSSRRIGHAAFKFVAILACALLHFRGMAQKQSNVWYFGVGAGLTFNTSPPSAIGGGQTYFPSPNLWNEGTSSICDSSGALLCYSNGAVIWNASHQMMPNGNGLMGHPSSTHAALIVPRPGSTRLFDLFTTDGSENDFANGLRHTVVDGCLNGGMGDVVSGSKNMLLHGFMAEKIAAVRHANDMDYWVVGHEMNTNIFHIYLLTANGITDSSSVAIGPSDMVGCGAQIVFSPDGGTLAYAVIGAPGHMALYDFDRATGVLSNARVWPNDANRMVWGLAFSPDGTKLYFTTSNYGSLRQLNLGAGSWTAIQFSEVTLGTLLPDLWKDLRLGPDGKIYVAHAQSSALGVIQAPDVLGSGCQFTDNAVSLTGICSFGLPNVVCAYEYTNSVVGCEGPQGMEEATFDLRSHPNPTTGLFTMEWPNTSTELNWELSDTSGRILQRGVAQGALSLTVDLSPHGQGLYFISVRDADGPIRQGRVLVL